MDARVNAGVNGSWQDDSCKPSSNRFAETGDQRVEFPPLRILLWR